MKTDLPERLRSMRSCTVCDGDGVKDNGKPCGGCGGVGEVPRYGTTGVEAADQIDKTNAALRTAIYRMAVIEDSPNLNAGEKTLLRGWIKDARSAIS